MATFRERLANFFLGDQKRELERMTKQLYQAYLEGPFQYTPDQLIEQLKEYDSALVYDLVSQISYDNLAGQGYGLYSDSAERERAIRESRRLYKYDVMYQWQIWLWTNFVFSESVKVIPNDNAAKDVWTEFWDADRNQLVLADDYIQRMSEDLLVDGNLFLVYYISTIDGKVTVSVIDPLEITDVVYGSGYQPLFYKRSFIDSSSRQVSLYYPSWRILVDESSLNLLPAGKLPSDSERADKVQGNTLVYVQHIAYNCKSRFSPFGYPLGTAGFPWIRAHKRFREDRATVASTVAMYVNKLKVKGGSRALDLMRSQLQSTLSASNYQETNPPAIAGSTWLENDAAELSRLPLGSGGGDAKADGDALLLMAGLGGGVYPHWMGAGDAYRLATATSMESPMQRQFNRYQRFWASQFRKMARIVFHSANLFGNANIQDYTVNVSIDALIKEDLQAMSSSIGTILKDGLQPYLDNGIITQDTAKPILAALWRILLQSLDVDNADELTSDEAFGVAKIATEIDLIADIREMRYILEMLAKQGGLLSELITDEGKFKPSIPSNFPDEKPEVEITAEDVQKAIQSWRANSPPEIAGILDAEAVEL